MFSKTLGHELLPCYIPIREYIFNIYQTIGIFTIHTKQPNQPIELKSNTYCSLY